MKIRHFLYNAFIIENEKTKIAIDPGQNLWIFKLRSLIPKSEWPDVTHILITHGDPDHYWQADRVAEISKAHVICGRELTKIKNDEILLVAPRGKGLSAWTLFDKAVPLDAGESVALDGVEVEGIRTVHGSIEISVLGFLIRQKPGPGERVGLGAMGYKITLDNKTIVNLGDSILQPEWEGLNPDILMIPIGGLGQNTWTMDVQEAIEAVNLISPKKVIPCHYNASFLWKKKFFPIDDQSFRREVEHMGIECAIMKYGDEILV
jgi:L-ascorbate metabolism protein UlaG (beta-lactamase superfamily)